MVARPTLYVAGNYSRGGKADRLEMEDAVARHKSAFKMAREKGYLPFSPILTTVHFGDEEGHGPGAWMDYDLNWLAACESFFCLTPLREVERDTGVHFELQAAAYLDKPIIIENLPFVEDYIADSNPLWRASSRDFIRARLPLWPIHDSIAPILRRIRPSGADSSRPAGAGQSRASAQPTGRNPGGRWTESLEGY